MLLLAWLLVGFGAGLPLLVVLVKFGKVIWEDRDIWLTILYDLRWALVALLCSVAFGFGISLLGEYYGGR